MLRVVSSGELQFGFPGCTLVVSAVSHLEVLTVAKKPDGPTTRSLPSPSPAPYNRSPDATTSEDRDPTSFPPIPPPEPEVRREFVPPPVSGGYRVDRTAETRAARIREVLAEVADQGGTPEYAAVVKRLGEYWPGTDWKTNSVKTGIYTAIKKAKGPKVQGAKRGRKPGSTNRPKGEMPPDPGSPDGFVPTEKEMAAAGKSVLPKPKIGYGGGVVYPLASLDVAAYLERTREMVSVFGPEQVAKMVAAVK